MPLSKPNRYKLLVSILLQSETSVESFITKLHISKAKLYRLTENIRHELAEVGLRLNLGAYRIEGNKVLVEYFYMTLFNITGTDISDLLSEKQVELVKDFVDRYFKSDVTTTESELTKCARRRYLAVMFIRLSQGQQYERGDVFVELMPLNSTAGTSVLTQYLMENYKLSGQDALTQTDTLKFVMKYGPDFILRLPNHEVVELVNGVNKSEDWRSIWTSEGVTPDEQVVLVKLELRIIGYILMIIYFGNYPVTFSSSIDQLITGEKPANFVKFRTCAAKLLMESDLEIVDGERVNIIGMLFYAAMSLVKQFSVQISVFVYESLYGISKDIIQFALLGQIKMLPIESYSSDIQPAIVVYAEKTELIEEISQNPDTVLVRWIRELPMTENYSRVFNAYRDERLIYLTKILGG
ncbi:helix-turn-helix domain-containing protein [Secundilactobacillus oryzae]|uniref:helix-turn-helix domain-containing protein n=1 Tax=Secundilactobacillus oryzae TaxID=1202668 RepID=UPI0006CFACCC|nr:helix-turn-helix domain-containing protein [Secundilactobacillus oryzae]